MIVLHLAFQRALVGVSLVPLLRATIEDAIFAVVGVGLLLPNIPMNASPFGYHIVTNLKVILRFQHLARCELFVGLSAQCRGPSAQTASAA